MQCICSVKRVCAVLVQCNVRVEAMRMPRYTMVACKIGTLDMFTKRSAF